MRNIAILEWGPCLLYVPPREQIMIRGWHKDGPFLPEYLLPSGEPVQIRYALSAHKNLNTVIANVRRCFGFPYTESVGFYNALTKKGRVRKGNAHILDKLSCWAIETNMDAIVWVDYEKSTTRKGGLGFNERAEDPLPFCKSHFDMVGTYVDQIPPAPYHDEDEPDHDD